MFASPRWLAGGFLAIGFAVACATASTKFLERKTLTAGDYSVEYSAGDEALAQDIAGRIGEIFETEPSEPDPNNRELTPESLNEHREDYLAAICHYLHLDKPTPKMTDIFGKFQSTFSSMNSARQQARSTLKHFQIWRGPELKVWLEAGQAIPNIALNPEGTGITMQLPTLNGAFDFSGWSMPLIITSRDAETGEALVNKKIKEGRELLNAFRFGLIERLAINILLHETVEIALIENYLVSKDRRWFCDGVANYVAYKVIEDKFNAETARRYYDIDEQLAKYADLRPTINLEKWDVAENQEQHDKGTLENKANYAFATEVMFKVEAKHGPEFLPELLAKVRQGQLNKTTMKTIYRAYKKLYDEDLRDHLPERN